MNETVASGVEVARPLVAREPARKGAILFGLVLAVSAAGLFVALEARRSRITSPATALPQASGGGMIAAPPELAIPPTFGEPVGAYGGQAAPVGLADQPAFAGPRPTGRGLRPQGLPGFAGEPGAAPEPNQSPEPALPVRSGAAVVYEASRQVMSGEARGEGGSDGRGAERVEASMFANPATTVPKGAIVQAVLETALDSTRAGPARALISRDVRSFDGSRVLIPRGSRLYGEYKADLSAGQNRALIQWQRLMRPDGAMIELDSPSADPLGRAGVRGKVNTHFFERFGGAILQSTLDIGVALATRSVTNGTVIIGLPGSTVPQVMATPPDQVKPTLKVPQGTAVSVFVARDLDFTRVER